MLRIQSNTDIKGFTEFEEDILFDRDDPDFDQDITAVPFIFKVSTNMSLASVHPAELHSSRSSLATLSHSLDDITGNGCSWSPHIHSVTDNNVMTIEELRLQMSSCFTCGVSWAEHHVSLDCSECGGYAMERPCIACDGSCGAVWKRDLTVSHSSGKARWQGECALSYQHQQTPNETTIAATTSTLVTSTSTRRQRQQQQQQELCSRLEKLSANS